MSKKKHEELDKNIADQDVFDLTISYDGTWHNRGHKSFYGIWLVIDI